MKSLRLLLVILLAIFAQIAAVSAGPASCSADQQALVLGSLPQCSSGGCASAYEACPIDGIGPLGCRLCLNFLVSGGQAAACPGGWCAL